MRDYTIGEAAKELDVSVHTLRYYEKSGLTARIARAGSGARVYSTDDMHFLDVLRCLRVTGMSIRDMKRFADLVRVGEHTIPDRARQLEEHRKDVLAQRVALDKAMGVVAGKISKYRAML